MEIEYEILLNQYAQDVVGVQPVLDKFRTLKIDKKRVFLQNLVEYFIMQSKPVENDIQNAIKESLLKPTYTPCVMLKKGVSKHNLLKIKDLPEYELEKVLILFLSIFKLAYSRRYEIEKNNPNKWWYWDLSDEKNVEHIKTMF